MRFAREGYPFMAGAWGVELALLGTQLWIIAAIWLVVAIWVSAFFRDPVRDGPRGEGLVLCPADGKVVSVITLHEGDVIGGQATRISIFMNVFNVHVNRYPVDGTVTLRRHRRGQFFHAAAEKAATENEQSDIGLRCARGVLLVRQIAGSIARRIVTDHATGTAVRQGERLGLIRFGSRVDLFLPANTRVLVKEGDVTRAGLTVMAEWT
jgi:phosphatidylserine decarboxylase